MNDILFSIVILWTGTTIRAIDITGAKKDMSTSKGIAVVAASPHVSFKEKESPPTRSANDVDHVGNDNDDNDDDGNDDDDDNDPTVAATTPAKKTPIVKPSASPSEPDDKYVNENENIINGDDDHVGSNGDSDSSTSTDESIEDIVVVGVMISL